MWSCKNAKYPVIFSAIYGVNFCSGARKAFATLANNILRVAALNSVGTFVLFLGKLAVVIATVLCGVQIMHVSLTAQTHTFDIYDILTKDPKRWSK